MDAEQFKTLSDKLDKVMRLLAVQTVKGLESEQDKVELLDSMGFRPIEIDKLLNKSLGYANAALANIRKKQHKGAQQPSTPQLNTTPQSAQPSGTSDGTP